MRILGGLSVAELLKRSAVETWRDAVFGQAGRMAFYHFLGMFPSLFLFLTVAEHSPSVEREIDSALQGMGHDILPVQAVALLQQNIQHLEARAVQGVELLSATVAALWAFLNATRALVYGLNTAYEVDEQRSGWKLGLTVVGLAFVIALSGWLGIGFLLAVRSFITNPILLRAVHWLVTVGLLLLALAVIYRFGPNLEHRVWRWSTPGALAAVFLWIVASVGIRIYFERINDDTRIYGHLNVVVMLLLWLYLTNAAILIGGEINSEIEKASDKTGDSDRTGN